MVENLQRGGDIVEFKYLRNIAIFAPSALLSLRKPITRQVKKGALSLNMGVCEVCPDKRRRIGGTTGETNGFTSGGSNQRSDRKGANLRNSVFVRVPDDLGEAQRGARRF